MTEPLAPTWVTLAERLREDILSARLSEGDPLPSEWALVEESGLTRAGVRRALAALAADGLIRTRPGNNGGSVVAKPNRAALVANIEVFQQRLDVALHVEEIVCLRLAVYALRSGRSGSDKCRASTLLNLVADEFEHVSGFE